jgi:cytochrome b561
VGRGNPVSLTAPPARYTRTAIALHWVIALLIVALVSVGLYMTDLPRNTPERGWFFNLHKSLGVLAAAIILLRLAWRWRSGSPPDSLAIPSWQATTGRLNHGLLYLCMLLMPVSGYLGSSFGKFGVKFFGLALPHWGWEDKRLQDIFVGMHHFIAPLFIALIGIHTAAALYHAYRRDGVFTRMWLRPRRTPFTERLLVKK